MSKEKRRIGFNKNFLLILIAVPLLVAIGVIAGNYFTKSNTPIVSGNEVVEEDFPEVTVPLEEFVLNLEPMNNINRYIRLEVSLSSKKEDGDTTINENLDKIRDIIIRTVGRQSVDVIFDEEKGTTNFKDVLRNAINTEFEEDLIFQVYITNIVVQ